MNPTLAAAPPRFRTFFQANRAVAPTFLAMAFASGIGMALLAARALVTGRVNYGYLPWNLFLAWMPLWLAMVSVWLVADKAQPRWLLALSVAAWLLFFPNAPYLCTDLVHLVRLPARLTAPVWYDLLLHLLFAFSGLWLGYASLSIMQRLVSRAWSRAAGWTFAVLALALGSFGVYMGRFLRWNSWDVVISPVAVASDIVAPLTAPFQHTRTWGFSVVWFLFLLLGYLTGHGFARLEMRQEGGRGQLKTQ
jgi:uncharacterized membrane protein